MARPDSSAPRQRIKTVPRYPYFSRFSRALRLAPALLACAIEGGAEESP